MAEINYRYSYLIWTVHKLDRLFLLGRKGSTERLMAVHDFTETSLERRQMEWAGEPQKSGSVVDGIVRLQLVNEPQALLGERERRAGKVYPVWNDRGTRGRGVHFLEAQLKQCPLR